MLQLEKLKETLYSRNFSKFSRITRFTVKDEKTETKKPRRIPITNEQAKKELENLQKEVKALEKDQLDKKIRNSPVFTSPSREYYNEVYVRAT